MSTSFAKSVPADFEQWISKIHDDGHSQGYKKGYEDGWAAAVSLLQTGMPKNGVMAFEAVKPAAPQVTGRPAAILKILKDRPGLTSGEILLRVTASGDLDAKATTVATTLQRLKNRATGPLVRNTDGKWYLNE